ncbi:MAG: fructose PTS transporter subunit IIA [Erysipelotrichaceae bacterium]
MKLKNENIFLDTVITTKQELFNYIADHLIGAGFASDKQEVIDKFNEREKLSPTGFENGIAIPHLASDTITEPCLIYIRNTMAIEDYESMFEDNEVKYIFAICVPENSGNEHLNILSSLSKKLMNKKFLEEFVMLNNKEEIVNLLSTNFDEDTVGLVKGDGEKYILAITACPTGIAHTYMAAEYMEVEAKKRGYKIKVEKQGANGIEDEITKHDIKKADVVIFAHAVALSNLGRFDGMNYLDVDVQYPIKHPRECITRAVESNEKYSSDEEETTEKVVGFKAEVMQAIMTGFSYMIPVIVAGGLLMGVASLLANIAGGEQLVSSLGENLVFSMDSPIQFGSSMFVVLLAYMNKFGWLIMQFMYPMFCAYCAYSISGKNALLPGFTAGMLAAGVVNNMFNTSYTYAGILTPVVGSSSIPAVPSGIFGAMVLAILAGYIVKAMNKWKFKKELLPLKTMLIIPSISVAVVLFVNLLVVEPVFSTLNLEMQQFITAHSSSIYVYAVIIAICTAFDLGGPINKSAGTVAIALAADGIMPITARVLAIVIPPIGIGVATFTDKLMTGKKVFSPDEKVLGQTSFILGIMAIGEGAIPFMIKHPLMMILINCTGAVIGSVTAIALGAEQWLPLPAIWGWPLVSNIPAYLIGMIVGVAFIAIVTNIARVAIGDYQKN